MKIEATFVTSAAGAADFPRAGLPEVALIGRSNVGKSSLINALARRRVARTSAAPGKTRLANVYRVQRGSAPPFHLVDLPGFGYSTGGSAAGRQFADVTAAYFGRGPSQMAALLLVDVRHPGLDSDQAAWRWLKSVLEHAGIVATKVDKLARGARIRALRELESVFEDAVLPVSAVTGEGLDELWRLIDNLVNNRQPHPHRKRAPKATAPPPPTE